VGDLRVALASRLLADDAAAPWWDANSGRLRSGIVDATRLEQLIAFIDPQLTLERFLDGGESGAAAVAIDEGGRRWVVKWQDDQDGAVLSRQRRLGVLTERLRERDYPVPRVRLIERVDGWAVVIREHLRGRPFLQELARPVDEVALGALLPDLLRLNGFQAGLAADEPGDWVSYVVSTVLDGRSGWCEVATLRNHSETTAALLGTVQSFARGHAHIEAATGDVVHGDFQFANILVEDARISGVVDWWAPEGGALAGDRAFDLATLAFYAWETSMRQRLLAAAYETTSAAAVALYLGHLIVRQVEWSIRHGHPQPVVERYLRVAADITKDVLT
jgi:aminoglycoside phosphotransferase (APT) family kinase protein